MNEFIAKLLDPEVQRVILSIISLFLFLKGKITVEQFRAEQMKAKQLIAKSDAKKVAAEGSAQLITGIFKILNHVPIINSKLPVVKKSVPDLAINIIEGGFGLLGDFFHNIPIFGTNIK